MSASDSINAHVNKVMSMGNLLKELGQPVPENMLMTKIVCNLFLSYNNILVAWTNVPTPKQAIANLKIRLLQMENLMALQGGKTHATELSSFALVRYPQTTRNKVMIRIKITS